MRISLILTSFLILLGFVWPSMAAPIEEAGTSTSCAGILRKNTGIDFIFEGISKAQTRNYSHPDRVSLTDYETELTVGDKFYLRNDFPKFFTAEQRPRKSKPVYEVTVVEVAEDHLVLKTADDKPLRYDGKEVLLVILNLYRRADFLERSRFEAGEYVQLGSTGKNEARHSFAIRDLSTGNMHLISPEMQPIPARFKRALNFEDSEIVFANFRGRGPMIAHVKTKELSFLRTGTFERLMKSLRPVDSIQPHFRLGEWVRYRQGSAMKASRIIRDGEGWVQIANGQVLPESEIFKIWTDRHPTSVKIQTSAYRWSVDSLKTADLPAPEGVIREYLDAAARFSGHPEFQMASFPEKLKLLLRFQQQFLPWEAAGNFMELHGVTEFSEILCSGAGVCRHNTPLMAAVLSEAGVENRIAVHFDREATQKFMNGVSDRHPDGHTWLEVISPEEKPVHYVVDPSAMAVIPFTQVLREAFENPASDAGVWWSQQDRVHLRVEEVKE